MSQKNTDFQHPLGTRWANALKNRFPGRHTAKRIASTFNISIRTAKSWIQGQAPSIAHIEKAYQFFGADIIEEIIAPGSDWARTERIKKTIEQVESQFVQMKKEISDLTQKGTKNCR